MEGKMHSLSVRWDSELHAGVTELAKERKISINALVTDILTDVVLLDEDGQKSAKVWIPGEIEEDEKGVYLAITTPMRVYFKAPDGG